MSEQKWQSQEVAEVEEDDKAEWIDSVKEGTVIEGTLDRAFLLPDEIRKSGFRACYRLTAPDGTPWNFGERFFFKDAIRALRLGSQIRITFLKEKPIGKKRTQWLGTFDAIPASKGRLILDILTVDYKSKASEIPF